MDKIIVKQPYTDTCLGFCMICSKEKLLSSYIEKLGAIIPFGNKMHKVISVKVTEEQIEVELDPVKEDYSVVFETREKAEQTLGFLNGILDGFKFVSVGDLNDYCENKTMFKESKIGWIDLSKAVIIKTGKNYTLCLPEPIEVK